MKNHRKNVLTLLPLLMFFVFFMHLTVYAYSPYVFKIVSDGKEQTGFIIQEKSGIITALHGVVGRQSITAQDTQGGHPFKGLKITSVDIEHDLAFLTSGELNKKKDGFSLSTQHSNYKSIKCIGYPLNVPQQRIITHLDIHPPYRELLWTLLPPDLRSSIQNRKSPDSSLEVLSIEGQLLPGCSGAPILNGKDQVVGVANGGLQIGSAISWAIPYDKKISWVPASSKQKELERLAKLEESALFSFNAFQASSGALLGWQEPRAGKMMTWNEANDYVAKKNSEGLMGYNDWRLPAVGELKDLAKFIKSSPGSYSDTDKLYWSSEDLGPYSVQAKVVNLGNAQMERECFEIDQQAAKCPKNNRFSVRLVRSLIQ